MAKKTKQHKDGRPKRGSLAPHIRIDIDNPEGQQPKLIGLWIEGFGWIVGGHRGGRATLRADLTSLRPHDIGSRNGRASERFARRWQTTAWGFYGAEHFDIERN